MSNPYDQGEPYPTPLPRGEGHDYVISPLPRHEESMAGTYTHNPLAEEDYQPTAGDLMAPRYVRVQASDGGQPHQQPWYAAPRDVPDDGTGAPRPVGV